jgi:hypothetical protein
MIHKDDLFGKFIEYLDNNGAFRICKVIRIDGLTVTVIDILKRRERVKSDRILHWIHHGHIKEPIDWTIRRQRKLDVEVTA